MSRDVISMRENCIVFFFFCQRDSNYIYFESLKNLSRKSTVKIFNDCFSVHRTLRILETYYANSYSSSEINAFSQELMFTHQISSHIYPKHNGLAE